MKKLTLSHIFQEFETKVALEDVSVDFHAGSIHAILGENGAGKSTLASILCGLRKPSSGEIKINDDVVVFNSCEDAKNNKISIVHQRPLLIKHLSVLENIVLGNEPVFTPRFLGIINRKESIKKIKDVEQKYKLEHHLNLCFSLNQKLQDLTADAIFYVAFLAALFNNPEVLILDEPSVSLDENQRKVFYKTLKYMSSLGMIIIVITHSLDEAIQYADSITVLKKGRLIITEHKKDNQGIFLKNKLTQYMFEKKITDVSDESIVHFEKQLDKKIIFSIENLTARPIDSAAIFDISFSIYSGEIFIIQGQRESGLETLENIITGFSSCGKFSGFYSFNNNEKFDISKNPLTTHKLRKIGVGIVPFDRNFRASNPNLTIECVAGIYENPQKRNIVAKKIISDAKIQINLKESASHLSGGMLQRLILARELFYKPNLLILSEPFQGLDKASSLDLSNKLVEISKMGTSILILTTDCVFLKNKVNKIYPLISGRLFNE